MHLAGIQEERGKGFWISILCMNRKQVARKYIPKKSCFFEDPSGERLPEVLQAIRWNRSFWEKKKQFSQIRRPPKWVDVPPRLVFRPDGGVLGENQLEMIQSASFDIGAVLVQDRSCSGNRIPFLQEAGGEEIVSLWDRVQEEKRMDWGDEKIPERGSHAFYSLGLALWGGEKIWRMVRYGG